MSYQVCMLTKDGQRTVLGPVKTIERAMKVAYPALMRGRVIDAWVVDDHGVERANLEAITTHRF